MPRSVFDLTGDLWFVFQNLAGARELSARFLRVGEEGRSCINTGAVQYSGVSRVCLTVGVCPMLSAL